LIATLFMVALSTDSNVQ